MRKDIYRKAAALALCLVMLFSLTACKSSAVKNVEKQIAALGEISAESKAAVEAAETAFAALSDSDKTQVENAQTLTQARAALDEALKEAKRKAIIGSWKLEADVTHTMIDELASNMQMDAEELAAAVGGFTIKASLDLREDGTYKMTMDAESFKESLTGLMDNLKPIMRDMMVKMLSQELLGREDGTAEEIDQLLQSTMGMSLDSILDIGFSFINTDEYMSSINDAVKEGKYLIDLDKDILYFSESLDQDPDMTGGEYFTLGDGVMEIADHLGEGFFEEFYPVKLTKIA